LRGYQLRLAETHSRWPLREHPLRGAVATDRASKEFAAAVIKENCVAVNKPAASAVAPAIPVCEDATNKSRGSIDSPSLQRSCPPPLGSAELGLPQCLMQNTVCQAHETCRRHDSPPRMREQVRSIKNCQAGMIDEEGRPKPRLPFCACLETNLISACARKTLGLWLFTLGKICALPTRNPLKPRTLGISWCRAA
jgi:hypothetical protein